MEDGDLACTAETGTPEPAFQDVREALYVRLLGEPKYVNQHQWPHAIATKSACVHIFVYAPSEALGCWTMLTSGMSDGAQYDEDGDEYRSELVAFSWDEPTARELNTLRWAAQFPAASGSALSWGHTISPNNPPGPIHPGATTERLWVLSPPMLPLDDFDEMLTLDDDTSINLFWLGTITREEAAFKTEHGSEALLDQFDEDDESWFMLDFSRESVVS